MEAGNYALTRLKGDDSVNHALDSRLEHENKCTTKLSAIKKAEAKNKKGKLITKGE